MDADVAQILTAVAKVEAGVERNCERIADLKDVTVIRLNDHTKRVKSLEMTRARQKGAARLGIVLTTAATAVGSLAAYFGLK